MGCSSYKGNWSLKNWSVWRFFFLPTSGEIGGANSDRARSKLGIKNFQIKNSVLRIVCQSLIWKLIRKFIWNSNPGKRLPDRSGSIQETLSAGLKFEHSLNFPEHSAVGQKPDTVWLLGFTNYEYTIRTVLVVRRRATKLAITQISGGLRERGRSALS